MDTDMTPGAYWKWANGQPSSDGIAYSTCVILPSAKRIVFSLKAKKNPRFPDWVIDMGRGHKGVFLPFLWYASTRFLSFLLVVKVKSIQSHLLKYMSTATSLFQAMTSGFTSNITTKEKYQVTNDETFLECWKWKACDIPSGPMFHIFDLRLGHGHKHRECDWRLG